MELRPPAPSSNEEIYQLSDGGRLPRPFLCPRLPRGQSTWPAMSPSVPTSAGTTGKTMVSDPVVVVSHGFGSAGHGRRVSRTTACKARPAVPDASGAAGSCLTPPGSPAAVPDLSRLAHARAGAAVPSFGPGAAAESGCAT